MADSFVKVHRQILTSSIMEEDVPTRYVWLCFLADTDQDGLIEGTRAALARRYNVPVKDFNFAIERLMAPDPESRSDVDGGARIAMDGPQTWRVINYSHYRQLASLEDRREKATKRKQKQRERNKTKDRHAPVTHGHACHDTAEAEAEAEAEALYGSNEPLSSAAPSDGIFESEFWDRWPKGRKIDKKKCERKFNRLSRKKQIAATGPGYQAWLDHWATIETQFIPHPMTWLNGERWGSDPPISKRKPSNESIQVAADFAEIADSHKKSCENARNLVDECIHANPVPELIAQLAVLKITTIKAEEMPAGTGYKAIVAQEDFLLDWVSDHYELEAPTTTGRRKLAREKIGLPVLY